MIIIFNVFVFLFVLVLLFWLLSVLLMTIFSSPTVYANDQAVEDSLKLANLKKGELVVDLGCGNAKSLILASKKFGAKGVGVEISPYCYFLARWRVFLYGERKNIKIIFGDFKKAEPYLKKADVVYLYLLNSTLKNIESWLFNIISKKTRVVSLAFVFPGHRPIKTAKTFNLSKNTNIRLYRSSIIRHK